MIRLSPIWNRCNVDMADEGENGLKPPRYIAPHDLNMVEVEHQPQVWSTDFPDDIRCQFNSVQEIARSVVVVQRLDGESLLRFPPLRKHMRDYRRMLGELAAPLNCRP